MLSFKAAKALRRMLRFGCFIKFLPYEWDEHLNRIRDAPAWHLFLYQLHHLVAFAMTIFSTTRFALTFRHGADPVPDLIRTMSALWVLAYALENVCYIQLHIKKDQIRFYVNALLDFIEDNLEADTGEEEKGQVYGVNDAETGGNPP